MPGCADAKVRKSTASRVSCAAAARTDKADRLEHEQPLRAGYDGRRAAPLAAARGDGEQRSRAEGEERAKPVIRAVVARVRGAVAHLGAGRKVPQL